MIDSRITYFMTVIEEGSFSAAARKLYLSQPALSKGIGALEKELGIRLLDRSGYRPKLTIAGKKFYDGMQGIIGQYQDLVTALKENSQIRIGFTGLYENRKIVKAIHLLEAEFAEWDISFIKSNFEESLRKLLAQETDICFGIESTFRYDDAIAYEVLFSYEMCVICSYDHVFAQFSQISAEQLKSEKMIVLSSKFGKNFYKDFMHSCKLDHMKPYVAKEVDSFDELVSEVSIGNGIAIVSKDVVRSSDVKVIELINSHHASRYVAAYLKSEKDVWEKFITEIKRCLGTL